MGGTISVSKGRGFALSTVDFDFLVARIRTELVSKHPSVVIAAFKPLSMKAVDVFIY